MVLVEEPLDLHLLAANPVSLIPVDFCHSDVSARESDTGNALELPPTSGAKLAPKPHDVSDPAADRYRLNVLDLTQELEVHADILTSTGDSVNSAEQ
jgi:hypothetical protein